MEMDKCTPYYWCLEANMRVLDLFDGDEKWYYTERVTKEDFMEWLGSVTVKPNSTPRKTAPYLEYRMYGLVPYNISPIQAAIQFGHGVVEYGQSVKGGGNRESVYDKWANDDKTFIILNGGTTNDDRNHKFYGSLQQMRDQMSDAKINFSEFREPDLNNALTSINFLVDERVFDRELYPDYVNVAYPWQDKGRSFRPSELQMEGWEKTNKENRDKWVEKIGGEQNDFLRTFLRPLRLANN